MYWAEFKRWGELNFKRFFQFKTLKTILVNRKPFLNLNDKSISGMNKSIYFAGREQISNSTHNS